MASDNVDESAAYTSVSEQDGVPGCGYKGVTPHSTAEEARTNHPYLWQPDMGIMSLIIAFEYAFLSYKEIFENVKQLFRIRTPTRIIAGNKDPRGQDKQSIRYDVCLVMSA